MTGFVQKTIQRAWRKRNALFYCILTPLSWVFALVSGFRRLAYKHGLLKSYALSVPVIIVGNIDTGGNGKTPVVIWLVEQLKKNGMQPGVISRGYGGHSKQPTMVNANSQPNVVGDEPVLIASHCQCPVWVGKDRVAAGLALLQAHPACNVIVSDDGLQHYRLKRTLEIAVVRSDYQHKTARLLPAGNLREPVSRLKTVDAIVFNGQKTVSALTLHAFQMDLIGKQFYNLADPSLLATAAYFKRKSIKALAGIGNPALFFDYLSQLGLNFAGIIFDDHYAYTEQDLAKIDCDVLIMTEKDAVKCKAFAKPHHWVLPVEAQIDAQLMPFILSKLVK